jgi:S-DNA-T family DNA segregation ATPase FtsK/SpoIIIE
MDNEPNGDALEIGSLFGDYNHLLELSHYKYPSLELLDNYGQNAVFTREELELTKNKIVETFGYGQIKIAQIKATVGPTLTLYEIIPMAGMRVSAIKNMEADIALRLATHGVRITGPIPGMGTMGIEVPHQNPPVVSMHSVMATNAVQSTQMDLPIVLGKMMSNEVFVADLAKLPHLLIAGATGQGKSVCINAILASLLYKKHPAELKLVLIDITKLELSLFDRIERHFLAKLAEQADAVISEPAKAIDTLNALCIELDQRYDLLKDAQVRTINEYNLKFITRAITNPEKHRYLPFIVLVIDEFAELMDSAKEVELLICRLAQLGRAAGIHLIISTQRPSVKIITGSIKANFTSRIAFRVSSNIDSRAILDNNGAEVLKGQGDMLLLTGAELVHLQGAFIGTEEVKRLSEFIGLQRGYPSAMFLPEYIGYEDSDRSLVFDPDSLDPLFEEAARLIVIHQQGSTSLIQRKLKLGYNRAGRIVDQIEAAGIVGPFEGSKAREVLFDNENALELFLSSLKTNSQPETIPQAINPEPRPTKTESAESEPPIMQII